MNPFSLEDNRLQPILEKILGGRRLDREDAAAVYRTHDLLGIGQLANHVCEQRHGNRAWCRLEIQAVPVSPESTEERIAALLELQSSDLGSHTPPLRPDFTGFTYLKDVAVARLLLDNAKHICAPAAAGKVAQVALRFGADTLVGPDTRELERLVRACGREPLHAERTGRGGVLY